MKLFNINKYVFVFLICCIAYSQLNAQRIRIPNNRNYDLKSYHFGFLLGLNQMNFIIRNIENLRPLDTLYGIESTPKMGFNIGIVADLRISEFINLRFIPSLSFGERSLNYFIKFNNKTVASVEKKVESIK
jgi:hypothetical protein